MRTVFLGTPEFALPSLEAVHQGTELVGVFTQPDRPVGRGMKFTPPPVKVRALALGVPVFQPERISLGEGFEHLRALAPDLIIVVAYGQILRQNVLDLPRLGCINVHASLLPRWRGAAPIQWALIAGDAITGVCTQQVVLALDAGDVWSKRETPIHAEDDLPSLQQRLSVLGAACLVETLDMLEHGHMLPQPQDPAHVTLAPKIHKEMGLLDLTLARSELHHRVQGLNPWPGTWVDLEPSDTKNASNVRVMIRRTYLTSSLPISSTPPPRTLFVHQGKLWLINAASEMLEVLEVQLPNKPRMPAAAALQALNWQGGILRIASIITALLCYASAHGSPSVHAFAFSAFSRFCALGSGCA